MINDLEIWRFWTLSASFQVSRRYAYFYHTGLGIHDDYAPHPLSTSLSQGLALCFSIEQNSEACQPIERAVAHQYGPINSSVLIHAMHLKPVVLRVAQ